MSDCAGSAQVARDFLFRLCTFLTDPPLFFSVAPTECPGVRLSVRLDIRPIRPPDPEVRPDVRRRSLTYTHARAPGWQRRALPPTSPSSTPRKELHTCSS